MKFLAALAVAGSCVAGTQALWAEDQITLKGGATFTGVVARKDTKNLYIRVPREQVAALNGEALPPPVDLGADAPSFSAPDLSGTTQVVPGPQKRVTLLQFWATWCPYCRQDMVTMKQLYAKYHDEGLQFVTVTDEIERENVDAFIKQNAVPYPVVAVNAITQEEADAIDEASAPVDLRRLADRYDAPGVPNYFLIDGQGKIVWLSRGALRPRKIAALEQEVARLLNLPMPAGEESSSAAPQGDSAHAEAATLTAHASLPADQGTAEHAPPKSLIRRVVGVLNVLD